MIAHTRQRDKEEDGSNVSSKRLKLLAEKTPAANEIVDSDDGDSFHNPYYLANFTECISYVQSSLEGHVITEKSTSLLKDFEAIDEPSQRLLVRLYLRQHKWLRVDKLSYSEIALDLSPLVTELVAKRLLNNGTCLEDTEILLSLLQGPELKLLCKQLHQPPSISSQSKRQCITSLIEYYKRQKPILPQLSPLNVLKKKAKLLLGDCVCISSECVDVFDRIMLMYSLLTSGESHEEITPQYIIYHMLQVTTGQIIYPSYQCNITRPLFTCKEDFERFYMVYTQQQTLASLITNKSLTAPILTQIVNCVCELFLIQLQQHVCTQNGGLFDSSSSCEGASMIDCQLNNSISNSLLTSTTTRSTCCDKDKMVPATSLSQKYFKTTPLILTNNTIINPNDSKKTPSNKDVIIDLTQEDDDDKDSSSVSLYNKDATKGPIVSLDYTCTCTPVSQFWSKFNPGSVCVRVLTTCIECWEKLRNYEEANRLLRLCLRQRIFGCHRRGNWWERLALNLDTHLKDPIQSLHCISIALEDDPMHDSIRYTLCQRAHKLCSFVEKKRILCSYKMADFISPVTTEHKEVILTGIQQPTTCLFIVTHNDDSSSPSSCSLSSVEGFAIHHYTRVEGWPNAVHGEGSSLLCLFVCLMWDCIFCTDGIPDVFRGPYQMGPLDFGREGFYQTRKLIIDERLKRIKEAPIEDLLDDIVTCWSANFGVTVFGVNWELFPNGHEDISGLALCFGNQLLCDICELFARDCYRSRGGVPDLVLWNKEEKTFKFVEVKGPGDRLSSKQVLWLSQLQAWGCPVEVCRVNAIRS